MFDRFTDRAKKVMSLARQAALELNHADIGTEHILLGLVGQGTGVAANVLKRMTVDLEGIRREVHEIVKTGPHKVTMGQLPFTPRAKRVLELSLEEASQLSHNSRGTEHRSQSHAAKTDNSHRRARPHLCGVDHRADPGQYRTPEQRCVFKRELVIDPDRRATRDHRVRAKCRAAKMMVDRLVMALQTSPPAKQCSGAVGRGARLA